jgi:DNA-binding CsgD family transcriptional regulator/tetratricopeptide (TPR) repeat protein/GTPase SAR1 family protein
LETVTASRSAEELLEREEALTALDALLADVRSNTRGRLVLIAGEAGVGKTALLRVFCEGQRPPVRVLWGGCAPLRTPRPLGPLIDVAAVVGGELGELVAGAPRPYEVAVALLDELRGRSPTVLVLEDVHWADEATLDVLTMLAARIDSVPALVLATYRAEEVDRSEQLRFVLGELVRRPGRLKLEPFSIATVSKLADARGIDGHELHRRTGGNPFFVTEVLATGGARIPETVRDAVLARAARLDSPARRLLDAIAVVPGQVDLWLLEILAGELVDRLQECLESGIVTAGGTQVAFRHELVRLAIEDATPPDRRLALHRCALAALAARDSEAPDFARLADHADAADDGLAVLRWAPRAAERARASGAHREAAAQYARALRFADGQPPQLRAELLAGRAQECYLTSQIDEAIAAQLEALNCHRRIGDRLGEGNALRVLSLLLFFAGRASEAEPLVLEAIELLERLPAGHELAMSYANVSQRRMVVQDAAEAVAWSNRALELARALGDTETEAYALSNIAAAEFRTDPDAGRLKLEAALELAQRHGHQEHAALTFNRLVMLSVRYRRFDIAQVHLEAGLEYCTERGLITFRLYLLGCRARMELDLGHWDQAADSAVLVLRDPRSAQIARTWALVTLGLVRARRGDADALAPLQEAHEMVEPTFELDRIAQVAAARAEASWLSGDDGTVKQRTGPALALALDRLDSWAVGELAYWRSLAGLHDELPAGLVATPYQLSIAGQYTEAADTWRKLGCPYEAALALAGSDDPGVARDVIEGLQQLGASPAAAIVARRLRERGVRGIPRGPRPRTRENPAGLTERELEVLPLIAEGLRNSQIAKRLVVSEKTVDHHVSAILRKLDVQTRGQAAAEAARLGLTGPA